MIMVDKDRGEGAANRAKGAVKEGVIKDGVSKWGGG
jgi:hypothetical protein